MTTPVEWPVVEAWLDEQVRRLGADLLAESESETQQVEG
jgi:hypothetical protein